MGGPRAGGGCFALLRAFTFRVPCCALLRASTCCLPCPAARLTPLCRHALLRPAVPRRSDPDLTFVGF